MPEDRREWLLSRSPRHPVLVAENSTGVVGWASLNQFNPRPCYDNVADFSVYVERSHRGAGVGSQLLDELISLAPVIGYHKLVLAALARNQAGMALYPRKGFRTVGFYREQGRLDGK
jgi:L-amino acid N-acyltransferase YncA